MTIKEEFEKWYELDNGEPLPDEYKILGQRYLYMGYKAAHEAQQVRIDELTEIIEIDQRQVIDNMTKAITAQQKRIDGLEMLLSEQLLIIKGFTLECEDMGTTDIITALSRKDTQITALEARCKELEGALSELSEFKFCDGNDFHLNIISHALSTKSPTEKEQK